jgi:DNA repair protein RadC
MKTQQLIKVSEVQLIYKNKVKASDRIKISCSRDAYKVFIDSWAPETIDFLESFKLLLMSRSNAVLGLLDVSTGGTTGTVSDIKVIFSAALKGNASGIICAHNHPSGNLNPSESDKLLTTKLRDAGNLMSIQLLDHLIISTEGDYFSFADNALI